MAPDPSLSPVEELGLPAFRERFPWWGADLQTLRDTLHPHPPGPVGSERLEIDVGRGDRLLALFDHPGRDRPRALVVLLHGLGGDSDREGLRRLGFTLLTSGFAVLRLNLRGAGEGRRLAKGSYAACCNRDLAPVLRRARRLAGELGSPAEPVPVHGVGISLGGTILLNACLEGTSAGTLPLDRLVCVSSPLDLAACSAQIEQPRNRLYEHWLLQRLRRQILADPFGLSEAERLALLAPRAPRTIRAFDALITAPRWGYRSVEHYYAAASPLPRLRQAELAGRLPDTLLVHAADDPWVPALPVRSLLERPVAGVSVVLAERGGHNGFHGVGDGRDGCWSDRLTARWLSREVPGRQRQSH